MAAAVAAWLVSAPTASAEPGVSLTAVTASIEAAPGSETGRRLRLILRLENDGPEQEIHGDITILGADGRNAQPLTPVRQQVPGYRPFPYALLIPISESVAAGDYGVLVRVFDDAGWIGLRYNGPSVEIAIPPLVEEPEEHADDADYDHENGDDDAWDDGAEEDAVQGRVSLTGASAEVFTRGRSDRRTIEVELEFDVPDGDHWVETTMVLQDGYGLALQSGWSESCRLSGPSTEVCRFDVDIDHDVAGGDRRLSIRAVDEHGEPIDAQVTHLWVEVPSLAASREKDDVGRDKDVGTREERGVDQGSFGRPGDGGAIVAAASAAVVVDSDGNRSIELELTLIGTGGTAEVETTIRLLDHGGTQVGYAWRSECSVSGGWTRTCPFELEIEPEVAAGEYDLSLDSTDGQGRRVESHVGRLNLDVPEVAFAIRESEVLNVDVAQHDPGSLELSVEIGVNGDSGPYWLAVALFNSEFEEVHELPGHACDGLSNPLRCQQTFELGPEIPFGEYQVWVGVTDAHGNQLFWQYHDSGHFIHVGSQPAALQCSADPASREALLLAAATASEVSIEWEPEPDQGLVAQLWRKCADTVQAAAEWAIEHCDQALDDLCTRTYNSILDGARSAWEACNRQLGDLCAELSDGAMRVYKDVQAGAVWLELQLRHGVVRISEYVVSGVSHLVRITEAAGGTIVQIVREGTELVSESVTIIADFLILDDVRCVLYISDCEDWERLIILASWGYDLASFGIAVANGAIAATVTGPGGIAVGVATFAALQSGKQTAKQFLRKALKKAGTESAGNVSSVTKTWDEALAIADDLGLRNLRRISEGFDPKYRIYSEAKLQSLLRDAKWSKGDASDVVDCAIGRTGNNCRAARAELELYDRELADGNTITALFENNVKIDELKLPEGFSSKHKVPDGLMKDKNGKEIVLERKTADGLEVGFRDRAVQLAKQRGGCLKISVGKRWKGTAWGESSRDSWTSYARGQGVVLAFFNEATGAQTPSNADWCSTGLRALAR